MKVTPARADMAANNAATSEVIRLPPVWAALLG
jgi:hypothetical protein